jgi:glucose uptake protein
MAGLAIAFPVAIGIALVVGTVLSFVQQQRGNVMMLGAGVLCAVVAVILDGKAYGELGANKEASRKSIIVCVISGVLMGLWAPFSTRALTHGNTLGPYSITVFLTGGALLSCLWWNLYFMKKPLVGEPVAFSGFFRGPVNGHVLGLLGGAIWTTGTVFNLVAASFTGVAISYSIGQSAPMVAALWGIFVWKEFAGANKRAQAFLALMFIFYFLAIFLIARANTAG